MWLVTLMDIFRREKAGQPLTSAELAFLRFCDGMGLWLAMTVVTAVTPFVKGDQPFTLTGLIHVTLLALIEGVGVAVLQLRRPTPSVATQPAAEPAAVPVAASESVALPAPTTTAVSAAPVAPALTAATARWEVNPVPPTETSAQATGFTGELGAVANWPAFDQFATAEAPAIVVNDAKP